MSPWGHGRWGFVNSRDDVIFVDFVQVRSPQMLNMYSHISVPQPHEYA